MWILWDWKCEYGVFQITHAKNSLQITLLWLVIWQDLWHLWFGKPNTHISSSHYSLNVWTPKYTGMLHVKSSLFWCCNWQSHICCVSLWQATLFQYWENNCPFKLYPENWFEGYPVKSTQIFFRRAPWKKSLPRQKPSFQTFSDIPLL